MTTPSYAPTTRSDDSSVDDNVKHGDQFQSTSNASHSSERVVTPIQLPVQSRGTIPPQFARGYNSVFNSTNPTFAALRSTTIQHAIGYPIVYVRILIQMGYEPIPASRGKTLFGKEALYYPNFFRYLKYVYDHDGLIGLYRGFGCSLVSKVVYWYTSTKVDEILGPVEPTRMTDSSQSPWNTCVQKILREVQTQSWGVLISHPFQVMTIRCMGQFVGREQAYSSINIFQNIKEIYEHQGIGGFFVGFIPRWLLEVITVVISNVIIHLLKTKLTSQNEMGGLYDFIASYVAQTATYPLSVVTTVMAINRSGLRAGMPPMTLNYANWHDACHHLRATEQLKRGSSLFNRTVLGVSDKSGRGAPVVRF